MRQLPAPEKLRKIAAFVERIGQLEREFGFTLGLGVADVSDPVTIGPDHAFAVVRTSPDSGPGAVALAVVDAD